MVPGTTGGLPKIGCVDIRLEAAPEGSAWRKATSDVISDMDLKIFRNTNPNQPPSEGTTECPEIVNSSEGDAPPMSLTLEDAMRINHRLSSSTIDGNTNSSGPSVEPVSLKVSHYGESVSSSNISFVSSICVLVLDHKDDFRVKSRDWIRVLMSQVHPQQILVVVRFPEVRMTNSTLLS